MSNISVIGAGTWGVALSLVLHDNGHNVTVWCYLPEEEEMLSKQHFHNKLPKATIPTDMVFTTSIEEAMKNDIIVMAVPSTATRSTAGRIKPFMTSDKTVISVSKGIEEATLMTQTQIIEDVIGRDIKIVALSGPSHAEEVSIKMPTLVVAGCEDESRAMMVQELFMNDYFRVYTSTDVTGIEVGAALKNVIALAAGITDGMGYGDNCKAALITRGIKEISTLAIAMGGKPETLSGLAGVGDLIVTCSSKHSRNRMCGELLGQGMKYSDALEKVGMVVEGVYSAKAAIALSNKYNVSMPITEVVNAVLFDDLDCKTAVNSLMTRDKKSEYE